MGLYSYILHKNVEEAGEGVKGLQINGINTFCHDTANLVSFGISFICMEKEMQSLQILPKSLQV